jgi:hypothetical protein
VRLPLMTGRLQKCMSWVAAESRPIHLPRWTSIPRAVTPGQLACHSTLPGATSRLTPMARPGSGWQAATTALGSRQPRWKSSAKAVERQRQHRRQRRHQQLLLPLPRHQQRRLLPLELHRQRRLEHLAVERRQPRGPARRHRLARKTCSCFALRSEGGSPENGWRVSWRRVSSECFA